MNPRIAAVLLVGFVAVLVFVGWLVTSRRRGLRSENDRLIRELVAFDVMTEKIWNIAYDARDIDPSAQLILIELENKTRSLHNNNKEMQ